MLVRVCSSEGSGLARLADETMDSQSSDDKATAEHAHGQAGQPLEKRRVDDLRAHRRGKAKHELRCEDAQHETQRQPAARDADGLAHANQAVWTERATA